MLGYLAGRFADVSTHSISRLIIYILLPLVSCGAFMKLDFKPEYIYLPLIFYGLSLLVTFIGLLVGKATLKDERAYLVGSAGVNGNALYFGLPIIWALFGAEAVALYLFLNLGPQINNITLGYFLTAKATSSLKDSLLSVAKFPVIYGSMCGLILNSLDIPLPESLGLYWQYCSGAMVILGMMMIGIAIANYKKFSFDIPLTFTLLLSKHIFWPLVVFICLYIDYSLLQIFNAEIYKICAIFCAMPLFANLIAYAQEHGLRPEKVALAVLISSLLSVFTVPALLHLCAILLPV